MKDDGAHIMGELGEEIYPGFHVGDRIKVHGELRWVSNIKDFSGKSMHRMQKPPLFCHTEMDPNTALVDDPEMKLHGGWVIGEENVELINCPHGPTVEEIAEAFGIPESEVP